MEDDSTSPEKMEYTEKELRVIQLLLEGKSTKLIALQFGISTRAVEHHITHIYEKLGALSRAEAIVKLTHLFECRL